MPSPLLPLLVALLPLAAMAILQFIMPVLAPLMMRDIGQPVEAYGWLGGAIGLGSVLMLMTSHLMLPVLGPVKSLRLGLVIAVSGIAGVLTGYWPVMLLGAVLIGYGYGTTTPAGSQVLADATPRELWGTLFSLRMAAVPLGGVMAGALGTFVAPDHGWRVAFLLVVGLCLLVCLVLLFVPRRLNETRPLKPFDAASLFDRHLLIRPARIVRATPGLASLALASWCLAAVHSTVTSFYVIYLVAARGLPLARAAMLFAGLQIAAICGRIAFGALADRIGSPTAVLKLLAPLGGGAALLLSVMTAQWTDLLLLAGTAYIGIVVGTFTGLYLAEVARLAPAAAVGDATASTATFIFTAYLIVPPLIGLVMTYFGAVAALRGIIVCSLAALVLLIWRDRPAVPTLAKDP